LVGVSPRRGDKEHEAILFVRFVTFVVNPPKNPFVIFVAFVVKALM
jgi:hypothetical protein